MHSTPNYGYTCNAPGQNDRDIERLKDKADNHGERITRNEERIKCLSGRVHSLECAPCGKEAPDCKPDSCGKALRRHLTDPGAHEELFEQKVDKKDGCRLICEDELQGIYDALDDRYVKEETYPKEKLYTQEEVDKLLAEKTNKSDVEVYDIPLSEAFKGVARYFKTQEGIVTIFGLVDKKESSIVNLDLLGTMPEGFRIKDIDVIEQPVTYFMPFLSGIMRIHDNGELMLRINDNTTQGRVYFNITYPAH